MYRWLQAKNPLTKPNITHIIKIASSLECGAKIGELFDQNWLGWQDVKRTFTDDTEADVNSIRALLCDQSHLALRMSKNSERDPDDPELANKP